jgi:hypothetical protein
VQNTATTKHKDPGSRKPAPLSLAALDAAISDAIGKPVRRDRLARDDRIYRWIIRRSEAEGSSIFNTTYAEAAKGAGYDVEPLTCRAARRRARERRVSTVARALRSLRAAGLIEFGGLQKDNGQWRCLTVRVLPGGRGTPQAGRSRRRPTRCNGRISFLGQSGTSPAVPPSAVKAQKRVPGRAGARALCPAPRVAGSSSAREQQARRARGLEPEHGDWPLTVFELRDQAIVELCDEFWRCFGRPARFSFATHGDRLRRILERMDRYAGRGGLGRRGAGLERAVLLLRAFAEEEGLGLRSAPRPASLAYFIPILDEISKDIRRRGKPLRRER